MTLQTKLASVWRLRSLAYTLAITLPVAVIFVRLAMGFTIGERPTLVLFVVPIILSAYLGGLGPGLVCTMMAALLSNLFLLAPSRAFPMVSGIESLQWVTMIVAGTLISVLNEALHRSRRRAEADRKLLAVTLASIGDAVMTTDIQGRITFLNAVAERLTGWTNRDAVGLPLTSVFPIVNEDTRQPVEDPAQTVLRSGTVVGLANHSILLARDGREIPIDDSGAPIKQADGEVQGVVLVFRDCSEQKQAEKAASELRAMEEEKRLALEANRMKGEFLANMSHELRTPLNGIIGFSEFLFDEKPGKLNAKQKEYLEDILNSGRHLLQLINDVLDLSKVEAGKMELSPETFSLPKAMDEVCAVVSQMAEKKGISIRRNIARSIGSITLDRQKFKQVLVNLLSNAVKFTDDGGQVDIIAGPHDPGLLKLQVRDTGIGIKPEDIGKLFAQFQQLDSSLARHHQGTGLGLALTKKIVEFQKGTVTVESEPGKGSTFTVILPLGAEKVLETSAQ